MEVGRLSVAKTASGIHADVQNADDIQELLTNTTENHVLASLESPIPRLYVRTRLAETGVIQQLGLCFFEQGDVFLRLLFAPFGKCIEPDFFKLPFRRPR